MFSSEEHMSEYTTRVGTSRRKNPVENIGDIYRIPSRERRDDGRIGVHVGDDDVACPDCKGGVLRWAEAGYVPWHRICDLCGSHWDLHPIPVYLVMSGTHTAQDERHVRVAGTDWLLDLTEARRGRTCAEKEFAVKTLTERVTPEMVEESVEHARGGVPSIPSYWFQRARFYR